MMFQIKNKDLTRSIRAIELSHSISDSCFCYLLNMVCITSSTKLFEQRHSCPPRLSIITNSAESEISRKFWHQWDKGLYTAEYLGLLCRKNKLDATHSLLWTLVSDTFKNRYITMYERRREVHVHLHDFENICKSVANKNILVIDEYLFIPRNIAESTNDYGLDVYHWKWKCFKNRTFIMDLHSESYEIAVDIFVMLNKRSPEKADKGDHAICLEFCGFVS